MDWIAPGIALLITGAIIRRLLAIGGAEADLPRNSLGLAASLLAAATILARGSMPTQAAVVAALALLFAVALRLDDLQGRLSLFRGRLEDLSRQLESTSESASSAILSRERRFRQLSRAAPVGIFEIDGRGDLVYVNELWLRITGLPDVDPSRLSLAAAAHPDDRPQVERELAHALREQRRFEEVFRFVHGDGRVVWAAVVAVPFERDDDVVGLVGTVLDVSAEHERQAERATMQRRLERAERLESLGMMAGGIAHELSNLLVPILVNGEKLRDDFQADGAAATAIDGIRKSARSASELAGKMAGYAGADGGQASSVELAPLIAGILEDYENLDGPTVEAEIEPTPLRIVAVRERIEQALRALLDNAREAMGAKAGRIGLRVGLAAMGPREIEALDRAPGMQPGSFALVEVSDRGEGFAEEILGRAYEPFVTTKEPGRGLGLLGVAGLARALGGGVDIASRAGEGARVRLFLPLATDESAGSRAKVVGARRGGRLLVVDDQEAVRQVVRDCLVERGYEVTEAADGLEATGRIAAGAETFAAILLDLNMPVMDGEEVLAWLRIHAPELPVLVLSGFGERELVRDLEKSEGRVAFLPKPFVPDELLAALDALLFRPPPLP